MMTRRLVTNRALVLSCAVAFVSAGGFATEPTPHHRLPKSDQLVVGLCDGETSVAVAGKKPNEHLTRREARDVSDKLMTEWKKKHPGSGWEKEERLALADTPKPNQQAGVPAASTPPTQEGHTYGAFSKRDEE